MWLLLLACAGGEDSFDPALAAEIQEALDTQLAASDAPGAALAVSLPGQPLGLFASGEADIEAGTPTTPQHLFRFGSITKTFVTAAVLLLVEEGAVDLDAPLSELLPDAPRADEITLRQCLTHATGLPDFVSTLSFLGNLDHPWTPEELLALIEDEEPLFAPGEGYFYSNINFILAGMVIETVTGQDYAAFVHERLIDPNGLTHVFAPSYEEVEGELARSYFGEGNNLTDVTDDLNPNGPWASGEMAGDVADLVSWAQALYGGDVLQPASLEDMLTPQNTEREGVDYGLGCYLQEVSGFETVGHSGSTYSYEARMRYAETEAGPVVVVTLVNNFLAEADDIDGAVWEILSVTPL